MGLTRTRCNTSILSRRVLKNEGRSILMILEGYFTFFTSGVDVSGDSKIKKHAKPELIDTIAALKFLHLGFMITLYAGRLLYTKSSLGGRCHLCVYKVSVL